MKQDRERIDEMMKQKENKNVNDKERKVTRTITMFESKGNHKRSFSQQPRNDIFNQTMKQFQKKENCSNENEIQRSQTPKYHSRGCSVSNVSMINGRIQVIEGLNSLQRNSTRMIEEMKEVDN